jgi:very-short-patch-repair endonuclease
MYWPHARLIGECDGAMKYSDQSSIVKEKEREQWFRDEDYGVVRWLGKEIMFHPPRVMARIEAALR